MDKLTDDIKTFFTDFEVSIKDLHTPTPLFVRDFYMRTLLELDVDDENVRKIQLSQNCVDQDEVEIIPELNLVTALKTAFPFNDIGLTDLLTPSQKRTCLHIRNVISYLLFADERLSTLNPHLTAYEDMKEKINYLKKQKEVCTQESNDYALKRNDLICRKKEAEAKLNEMQNALHTLTRESYELNSKKNLAVKKLEKNEMFRLSCVQELGLKERQIEELRSEIVDHPEIDENKLKQKENLFTKLNDRKQEIKVGLKEKKNQRLKLKVILEALNEELLLAFTHIVDEIKKSRGCEQQLANLEKEIKNLATIKEGQAKKVSNMQDLIANDESKKKKLLEEWQLAEAEVKKSIEDNKKKYPEKMAEFKIAKKESSQAKKKRDDANKRIEDSKKKVAENKKTFEELNYLLNKKEEEEGDWISKFFQELEPGIETFIELKSRLNKLSEEYKLN